MIKKLPSGRWQVDIQPGGRGQKRVRKSFDSKADAQRFERWVMSRKDAGEEWNPKKDRRTLLALIDLWYLHHGHSLKDGESRKRKLIAICEKLGYPKAAKVTSG